MTNDSSTQGFDSFLDIVANLVGILIILVVVVGAQAATVWNVSSPESAELQRQLDELNAEKKKVADEAKSIQNHNAELRKKAHYQQRLNHQLAKNRHDALIAIDSQKQKLGELNSRQSSEESKAQAIAAEVDRIQRRIEQVRFEFSAVEHAIEPKVKTIDHYPTPIAKTVFADEIHFQISNRKIAYVPMDELLSAMKKEWKVKANKLKTANNTWETVGPIDKFRLQYLLNIAPNPNNPSQYGIRFDRFELQPTVPYLGEELNTAVAKGSDFDQRIGRMAPSRTTVTFWVYPDSYNVLLKIREELRQRGFQTASWPMKFGQSISGSPRGFRTTTN